MPRQSIRRPAVAGSWYPRDPETLRRDVTHYLGDASAVPGGEIIALIAPHAGLVYSGPVAAYAYKALERRAFPLAVLLGPSHFAAFEGIAVHPAGAFETPFGPLPVPDEAVDCITAAAPIARVYAAAHAREHSLEMQLPFLGYLLPGIPILPLLMGYQTRDTIVAVAEALASAFEGRGVLLVASTDLSHFFPAEQALALDARVQDFVGRFDPMGLLGAMEAYPEHERGRFVACGGGPAVSVMLAAQRLGARESRVLRYAHSGDVSGDMSAVVGYLAAAIGNFDA
jgi:AmmeMemoRadiSam system protein B